MSKTNIIREFKGGSMARTLLIRKKGEKYVRKVASNKDGLAGSKLMDQWKWLYQFNEQEPGIFPDVSFFISSTDYCYYDMEYVELDSLRDLLVSNDDWDESIINEVLHIGSVIATRLSLDGPVTDSYIMEKHLVKMITRNSCISSYDFYKAKKLEINGRTYDNLDTLLNKIKDDDELLKLLRPKAWYRSHGDFTFQNVLADEYSICAIDPRGEMVDSIYYDLGKLLQSSYAKYDLLYEGNYYATLKECTVPEIEYGIKENVEKFDLINEAVMDLIPEHYELHDEHWELIAKFYCASHMLSMTPFRLKENPEITVICYAIGIEILNEVLNEWEEIKNGTKQTVGNI